MAYQFDAIDLAQLQQVAGGGKIGRKIRKALKSLFDSKPAPLGGPGVELPEPTFEPWEEE